VPRPRILESPKVVPFVLEESLYLAAKKVSEALGISMSQMVREALTEYIKEQSLRLGLQIALPDPYSSEDRCPQRTIDVRRLLNEPALEELDRQMREIEKMIPRLEETLSKAGFGCGCGPSSQSSIILRQINRIYAKTISMKKLAEKLANLNMLDVERAKKVVEIYKRAKSLKRKSSEILIKEKP